MQKYHPQADEMGRTSPMNEDREGDYVAYEDAQAIEEERDRLKEWKESALEVEKTWDVQAIANEMDLGLGESIRSNILPYIKRLKAELADIRAELVSAAPPYYHKWQEAMEKIEKLQGMIDKLTCPPYSEGG